MMRRAGDEAKKEFLSILSHELRNPLAAILSSVELLRLQESHSPGTSLLLGTIEERVRIMTAMLDNLLVISRIPPNTVVRSPVAPRLSLPSSPVPSVLNREGQRILVVDDNELAAEALGRLLELRGHYIAVAYSGAEALEKAKQFAPQVIILDIGLPDISGYEVARLLKENKKFSATLIALTGYGHTEDKERALAAGFRLHLTKPVSLAEVEQALLEVSRTR